jgi:serine/threonine protein kinase/tetratricopeptide (TPR) repeat protein
MTLNLSQPLPKIGPFQLVEVVGQAGMGVVWRGIHQEQQVPIAVKFLTQEGSRDPLYLGCLKNEVRKVAALEHPAIINVYDHGEVPEGLGIDSLIPGSPYLVMEFAEGGTLSRHCGRLGWEQIWRVLMRLLDGLAHAHARGVVHRDIKPGNVLLRRSSGGVVLIDFGLARAGDTDGGAVLNAGTPSYMAPEQIRQHAYEIGPWTDMYGLGCLAWSLACGKPPFQRDTMEELLKAHLFDPLPKMRPVTEVPSGFEAWVGQLLRKAPHHRYVRAADAAHVLSQMAQPEEADTLYIEPVFHAGALSVLEVSTDSSRMGSEHTTAGCDDTQIMNPRIDTEGSLKPAALPKIDKSLLWAERGDLPPIPDDWREQHPPRLIRHLLGTGLAMFGLRNFPVVGRETEQNQLWKSLKRSRAEKHTRAMVIQGADGTGKTHLAEWLARRASEVGAAIVLRARFDGVGSSEPLIGLIRSLLSTDGLEREAAEAQVRTALEVLGQSDEAEVDALLTVLGPFPGEHYSSELMEERSDVRFTVIRRILHRFSVLRPVIVLMDDAHLDDEAIRFVQVMLAEQSVQHPILVLLTANTMSMSGEFREQLGKVTRKRRVDGIQLGPLAAEDRSVLVRELLGLEPSLAALVERRSGGNPQFAVQLVGDWIQKGHLVRGEVGFAVRQGVQPDFPADLQAVWERRLDAALPLERDTRCLQLAAELGMEVDPVEWKEACSIAGIPMDSSLIETLTKAHLVVSNKRGGGWAFAHTLVRESLKRQAEFEGIRVRHHVAVAEMLSGREGVEGRLGRHLLHAGDLVTAVDVLLAGAERCRQEGRQALGMELLALREKALVELQIPTSDLRWVHGWMVQQYFYRRRKNFLKANEVLSKVLKVTDGVVGTREVRARAWLGLGGIHRLKGEPEEARLYLNKVLQQGMDDISILSRTMDEMGVLELAYGNHILAAQFFEGALKYAEKLDNKDEEFRVRQNMAGVYRRQGDTDTAHVHLSAALKHHRKTGSKQSQARCLNDLAELDRFTGNWVEAEEGYRQALAILSAVGDQRFFTAGLNLGIIYSETGRSIEARAQLERSLAALKVSGLPSLEGCTLLTLSHVHAQLGDTAEWERCFAEGCRLIRETGFFDVDIARAAQLGGEVLLAKGQVDEARQSLAFARDHWESLERNVEAAALTDMLLELE